jgi:hypothetical protein
VGERDLGTTAADAKASNEHDLGAWAVLTALLAVLFELALRLVPAPDAKLFARSEDLLPFLGLAVGRKAAVAAAAAVALAAVVVALTLERRIGKAAPVWVAVFLFASVAFAAVLWTPAAAILMAAVALAFALAQGGSPRTPGRPPEIWDDGGAARGLGGPLRWLAVGALLGLAAASNPIYAGLLAPAALMAPALGRRRAWLSLAVGAGSVLAAGLWLGGVDRWLGGVGPTAIDVKLFGWNALYLFAGRNVGLIAGFLPLLLAFGSADEERGRMALGVTVIGLAIAFALLRPFDFFGGPSAVGNRFFLPLYGAAWLCPAKPSRRWPALAVAVLAGFLLWPLWRHPLASPLDADGRPRLASVVEHLPFELSQRDLPAARDVVHHGLRARFPGRDLWPAGSGESLRLGGAGGEVVFAAPVPLGSLLLELGPAATPRLTLTGGELGEMILRPDGDIAFVVTLDRPYAVMPAWWSRAPVYWYRLRLRFPEPPLRPIALSLEPQRKPEHGDR